MPASEQGTSGNRYQVIPRTLIFITRGDALLLIKGAPTKRLWANKYNGIGGHIERGEDALSAARRELQEETGLQDVTLRLVGTILIDAGAGAGIALYVFSGQNETGALIESAEGQLEWVPIPRLADYALVEDLPIILPRVLNHQTGDPPFSARYFYDKQDRLQIVFAAD